MAVDKFEEISQYLPQWTKETITICHDSSYSSLDYAVLLSVLLQKITSFQFVPLYIFLSLFVLSRKSATNEQNGLFAMQISLYTKIRTLFFWQPLLVLYLLRCTIKCARRSSNTWIHIKITRRLKVKVETSQIPFSCANSPSCNSIQQYSVPWDGLLLWESIRGILVAVQRFATTSLGCL